MTTVQPLYLSVSDVARMVGEIGVGEAIAGIADNIGKDFVRWEDFHKIPRVPAHSQRGVIELMPVSDASLYSCKYVNGHPGNNADGIPTVMAFGFLCEMETGAPLLMSELTLTTALRTAAMSVFAAKTLARPDSRVMAVIGNGAQSEFQVMGFHSLMGINEVRLFDIDRTASERLVRNLTGTGINFTICSSAAEACQGADIVTTITADKKNAVILTDDMIEPGMHLNAVGGDSPGKTELDPRILDRATVFVEFEPQSRIEGEIQNKPADFPVTELWRVLTAQAKGRTSDDEITLFDSVGFALEDMSALRYLLDQARERGIGQPMDLIAQSADPRDLFSVLKTPTSVG